MGAVVARQDPQVGSWPGGRRDRGHGGGGAAGPLRSPATTGAPAEPAPTLTRVGGRAPRHPLGRAVGDPLDDGHGFLTGSHRRRRGAGRTQPQTHQRGEHEHHDRDPLGRGPGHRPSHADRRERAGSRQPASGCPVLTAPRAQHRRRRRARRRDRARRRPMALRHPSRSRSTSRRHRSAGRPSSQRWRAQRAGAPDRVGSARWHAGRPGAPTTAALLPPLVPDRRRPLGRPPRWRRSRSAHGRTGGQRQQPVTDPSAHRGRRPAAAGASGRGQGGCGASRRRPRRGAPHERRARPVLTLVPAPGSKLRGPWAQPGDRSAVGADDTGPAGTQPGAPSRTFRCPGADRLVDDVWPGAGLNRRPTDFQSVALPTELPGRARAERLAGDPDGT